MLVEESLWDRALCQIFKSDVAEQTTGGVNEDLESKAI